MGLRQLMGSPMKRLLLLLLAVAIPLGAFAQDRTTVSNYFANGVNTCTSTRTRLAPTTVGTRSFGVYNLASQRCYFGSGTVTTANGTALCSSSSCPSTSQAWSIGNVSAMWMIAAVGTSVTVNWDGAGF